MKLRPHSPAPPRDQMQVPARRRLQARVHYPGLARVPTHRGPLQRLAWIFGFGRG